MVNKRFIYDVSYMRLWLLLLLMMILLMFTAAIHDRYLPDSHLLQRLHHRIHHGNHLYTDVGLVDSDSVLQVTNTQLTLSLTELASESRERIRSLFQFETS